MPPQRPILIAGGGPVGVITALALARQGIAVEVFEAEQRVNDNPRAATTHAATLEILDGLGLVDDVIARGLIEPKFRVWDRATREVIAEFDFGVLKDDTRYPFVVQCEQHKLAKMTIERLGRLASLPRWRSRRASWILRNSTTGSKPRSRRRPAPPRRRAAT